MRHLKTSCGTVFKVDDDVYTWAKERKWQLKNGYPGCSLPLTRGGSASPFHSYLHRELMHYPIGHVHHLDGDKLNCRKQNLQVLSPQQHVVVHNRGVNALSSLRRSGPRGASGYKGVSWHKIQQRWTTQFTINGKTRVLGYAPTPEEAALLYDAAVIAFVGAGAYTNLIPNEAT